MEILAICTPQEWKQIEVLPDRDLSVGTGFERALEDARRKLAKESEQKVTFWVRGDVLLVKEFGGLEIKPQPPTRRFELKAKIEGLLEKCFTARLTTGQSEWVECKNKDGNT